MKFLIFIAFMIIWLLLGVAALLLLAWEGSREDGTTFKQELKSWIADNTGISVIFAGPIVLLIFGLYILFEYVKDLILKWCDK